ncbi:hypothetical protein [Natronobiforma cellulositropha]|uniref:hypothetical protein n=1 Tax=Natronobiforma cellulositropha TaxID=1679076 RepID=UPI0021D5F3C8|nr:hypothetical protein [Natronobiforma cellulositropha]
MSFSIADAVTRGIDRTLERNSAVLAAVFFVLATLSAFAVPAIVAPFVDEALAGPLVLDISPALAGLLYVLAVVAMSATSVVALRVYVTEEREAIPEAYYREGIGFAVANLVVGGFVFSILVTIGFVLFILPGLFLLVALYYWTVFVAVEDDNFVSAMKRSWALTSGARWPLFGLGVVVVLLVTAVTMVVTIPGELLGGGVAIVLSGLSASIVTVFTLATTGAAFVQLQDREHDDDGPDPTPQAASA